MRSDFAIVYLEMCDDILNDNYLWNLSEDYLNTEQKLKINWDDLKYYAPD